MGRPAPTARRTSAFSSASHGIADLVVRGHGTAHQHEGRLVETSPGTSFVSSRRTVSAECPLAASSPSISPAGSSGSCRRTATFISSSCCHAQRFNVSSALSGCCGRTSPSWGSSLFVVGAVRTALGAAPYPASLAAGYLCGTRRPSGHPCCRRLLRPRGRSTMARQRRSRADRACSRRNRAGADCAGPCDLPISVLADRNRTVLDRIRPEPLVRRAQSSPRSCSGGSYSAPPLRFSAKGLGEVSTALAFVLLPGFGYAAAAGHLDTGSMQ